MILFRNLTKTLLFTALSASFSCGMEKLPFEEEGDKGKMVSIFKKCADQQYQETVLELKDVVSSLENHNDTSQKINGIHNKLQTLILLYSHAQALDLSKSVYQAFLEQNTPDYPCSRHAGLTKILFLTGLHRAGFESVIEKVMIGDEKIAIFLNDVLCNKEIITKFFDQFEIHISEKALSKELIENLTRILLDSYIINPFHIYHAHDLSEATQFLIGQCYFRASDSKWFNNFDLSQASQYAVYRNQLIAYLEIALKYYILAAKQGHNGAYKDLLYQLKFRTAYEEYYKILFPLLEAEDAQAQDLFNRVASNDREAFKFFDKLGLDLFQNDSENPLNDTFIRVIENHMRFLRGNSTGSKPVTDIFRIEKQPDRDYFAGETPVVATYSPSANEEHMTPQEQFKKAMSCWNSAPEETLRLFFDILGNAKSPKSTVSQVNKKLAEIKKKKGYRQPDTIKQKDQLSDIGYLLYLGEKNMGPKPSSTKQKLKSSQETKHPAPKTNTNTNAISSKKKQKGAPKPGAGAIKENDSPNQIPPQEPVASQPSKKAEQKQAVEDKSPVLQQDAPQALQLVDEKSPTLVEIATLSGEGTSILSSPLTEVKVSKDLPIAKELDPIVSENKAPNTAEKTSERKVGRTLELKNSPKKLSRRNSADHLTTEPGLDAEKPKLRRTVTVTNLPTFASTTDEKPEHHKKTLSKKMSLSNLIPWKEKGSKKSQKTTNENDPIAPQKKTKSKRLSVTGFDSSLPESEGEGKKTPRKISKKSSSSSLSSSMESSPKAKNPEDSLISHKKLPEKSADYYPRHYRRLHAVITHKYKLKSDDEETLKVILGERERAFEIDSNKIKHLFAQFETTKGSHHKRHEVIDGMGLTLNPNADGLKKGSYNSQVEQAKEKLITILAPTLTVADLEAAQNNKNHG